METIATKVNGAEPLYEPHKLPVLGKYVDKTTTLVAL